MPQNYGYYTHVNDIDHVRPQKRNNLHKEPIYHETWQDPFYNIEHKKDGALIIGEPIEINSRSLYMPTGLKVRDLPYPINSKNIQRTNFFATEDDIETMLSFPKFMLASKRERFDSSFSSKDTGQITKCYARTVYYLTRADTPSHLPFTYRLSVAQNISQPEDWSIALYAMAGGREKGLMFLKRLDNDPSMCHKEGAQYIPTPHMHSASPLAERAARPERPSPEFIYEHADMSLEQGLAYMTQSYNIIPFMVADQNDDIRTIAKKLKRNEIQFNNHVDIMSDLSETAFYTSEYYKNIYPDAISSTPSPDATYQSSGHTSTSTLPQF